MKEITIAVSPMVRQIFLSRYGEEPIQINRSDTVYYYLQGDIIRVNENKFRHLSKRLTSSITLSVSSTIYDRLSAGHRRITVGYFLHKVFQEEMLIFMEAQKKAGVPAQTALKTYLEENNISEDAYALETAYTAWKRKKQFFQTKTDVFVCSSELQNNGCNDSIVPVDPREIIQASDQYYDCGLENLLCRSNRVVKEGVEHLYIYDPDQDTRFRRPRKILSYLLNQDSQLTGVEIAKFIRLSPRTIQRYVRNCSFYLEHYEDFQRDVQEIRELYRV